MAAGAAVNLIVRRTVCPALLVALVLAGVACNKVSSDNIQLWKTTEKGPGKLKDAFADRGVDAKLRAEAAAALIDIGRSDDVDEVLAGMQASERWDVFKALIPEYIGAMKDTAPEKSLAFRDALFSVRAMAQPDDQARIDGVLLPQIEAELRSGRIRNGRHSVEKILTAMGKTAGETLARLLGQPIIGYQTVAELLARVGDEPARLKGAGSLVERARKEKSIPEAMWRSLGVLGGPEVIKFLEEKIEGKDKEDAANAVRALAQRREPEVLTFALKVAGDAKADRTVRDEMFGVVESIGGLEARSGLIHIIQTDHEELVRYRAFESLLAVAKQDGVVAGLEAFPAGASYKKVDVDDLLVKLIEKLGPSARPTLVKALESKQPLARMTAVLTLEQLGKGPDAAALEKLTKDTTTIKGFPAGDSIGKEAARVAGVVRGKA